jgi:hypothetical protein
MPQKDKAVLGGGIHINKGSAFTSSAPTFNSMRVAKAFSTSSLGSINYAQALPSQFLKAGAASAAFSRARNPPTCRSCS